jgi:hypothetical protein
MDLALAVNQQCVVAYGTVSVEVESRPAVVEKPEKRGVRSRGRSGARLIEADRSLWSTTPFS